MTKRKKIALVLGSGGARGIAHVGVIKTLAKNQIPIDYIVGCSAGAIVGAWLALGKEIDELENFLGKFESKTELAKLLDFGIPSESIIRGKNIYKFIQKICGDKTFEDTVIPLKIIATDITTGEEIQLTKGSLADAVMASISIPGIFPVFELGGRYLIDGGVSNPTPSDVVLPSQADVVISVDLTSQKVTTEKKPTILQVLQLSYEIMRNHSYELHHKETKIPTLIIKPKLRSVVDTLKFFNIRDFIISGENACKEALPEINKLFTI